VELRFYSHLAQRAERQLHGFHGIAELPPQLFTNAADRRVAEQRPAYLRRRIEGSQLVEGLVELVVALHELVDRFPYCFLIVLDLQFEGFAGSCLQEVDGYAVDGATDGVAGAHDLEPVDERYRIHRRRGFGEGSQPVLGIVFQDAQARVTVCVRDREGMLAAGGVSGQVKGAAGFRIDDGCTDAGVVAGVVDRVANAGERAVVVRDIHGEGRGSDSDRQRARTYHRVGIGERAGSELVRLRQLLDLDGVACRNGGLAGGSSEDLLVTRSRFAGEEALQVLHDLELVAEFG